MAQNVNLDDKATVRLLNDLIKLDIDAKKTYDQAISNVDDAEVRRNLESFRDDHLRHVRELTTMVQKLGGEPAKPTPDVKGFFLTGFTAIRSATGTTGALKAMRTNEMLTTSTYKKALDHQGLSPEVRALIQRNYQDEQRHLAWISQHVGEAVPA